MNSLVYFSYIERGILTYDLKMLMAKTKFYRFDQSSLNYQPVVLHSKNDVTRSLLFSIAGGLCLSIITVTILAFSYGNIQEVFLREIQKHIVNKLSKQDLAMRKIETSLNKLHENDQTFYRSIINKPSTDKSVWEAGVGGKVEYGQADPAIVKNLSSRREKIKHKFNIQKASFLETRELAISISAELAHIPAIKPISGRIVSGFGYRADPFHGSSGHFHSGLDIVAGIGTPVKAVADGTIITSGAPEQGYGLQVEVNHGYGYVTKYAHLSSLNRRVGEVIKRGDIIGYTGNTGYSTGPHLHYEVIKNGTKTNPLNYFYGE